MTFMTTATDLGDRLGVDPEDVLMVVHSIDEGATNQLDDELAADVEQILNPNGERTAV
jgi:hypothetical protein